MSLLSQATKAGFGSAEAQQIVSSFESFDKDHSGSIDAKELFSALKALGENPSAAEVAKQIKEVDADNSGMIEFKEFLTVIKHLRDGKSSSFGRTLEKKGDISINVLKGEHATHSFSEEEKMSFAEYINDVLKDDSDCKHLLPLNPDDNSIFGACRDGILLCKLINDAVPDTIDVRVINKVKGKGGEVLSPRGGKTTLNVHQMTENLNLAVNSAKAIGCTVVNVGADDIRECREHVILGLIWQIIRIGLLSAINLQSHPELFKLLEPGEDLNTLMKLPPDQILLRWLNYHLKAAGDARRAHNFSSDIKDSHIYTVVMNQVAPKGSGVDTKPLKEGDMTKRAEMMLQNADKIQCRKFIKPKDVVEGNSKLNLAFVAHLFNTFPGLGTLTDEEKGKIDDSMFSSEGTREARAFMLWINSLGIDPFVNHLFDDLHDGLIILKVMDAIRPGTVDWAKVNQKAPLNKFKKLENNNYAVALGKNPFNFSLPTLGGENIHDCQDPDNHKLVLGLLWQMMRFHVLAILKKCGSDVNDEKMIAWANDTVKKAGKKSKCDNFKDQSLRNGLFLIDLLDAVRTGCVDPSLVTDGVADADAMLNAKYCISLARKIGCTIFCCPEDIVEVKPKMLLTLIGSIMAVALTK